ncbi:tripartite motif-containing 3 [Labeo rohita]|uniref:E3 ubiquitin-protein ligase TRIM32 n=2 Tax=Labeo rohita TaxID=84645 RepID=A0ABQ8MEN5_LABRO|nr:E3 ubiquitin-protein ligase TRIM32 [Labeo rohita]RXN28938.1 tripartite motif-containing 3 [Labeo rohita]
MSAGSPVSNKTSPSTSPQPPLSPLAQSDIEGHEDPKPTPVASSFPLPCWATQALCDLARCETDLRRLREQQVTEAQTVGRGVERALLGAQREERRLLERVEQDHRDVQLRLEQVQRDNGAAVRVGQRLVDQRLYKVIKLRELIKICGGRDGNKDQEGDTKKDQLLKGVAELVQPWEVSLTLKRVSFKPSAQPNAVTFGDIKIQDHNVHFPIGGCGQQGQMCPIHANEVRGVAYASGEGQSTPDGTSPGQNQVLSPGPNPRHSSTSSGNLRVVRKLRLSARSDEESGEEVKHQSPQMRHRSSKQVQCERDSSQEDECESPSSECKADELFLAVPSLSHGESEGEDLARIQNGPITQFASQRVRRQRELSLSPEQGHQEQDGWFLHQSDHKNHARRTGSSSPQTPREIISSQGNNNHFLRGRSCSQLSASSDDHPQNRAPSPADSVDSGYTFIVSSPRDFTNSLRPTARLSRSAADLSYCNRPLSETKTHQSSMWTVTKSHMSSKRNDVSRTKSCPSHGNFSQKNNQHYASCSSGVSRSLSMSVIDNSSQKRLNHFTSGRQNSLNENRLRGERSEPALLELEEDAESLAPEEVRLVRQFGKQGSGRADLTLPSGVHATPQGQLFLVDCGNARVQVTDALGNVLQQVTSPSSDLGGSSRRCRNYFDVAVNAKGLIALSCAAERALLILSRHGRLLQTFGGGPYIAGVPRDELEAPRGVTVTQRDEFLVADIRKGTLTALKLEPKTGSRLERTVVTGFHRPYLVAACLHSGLVAVSERGSEMGQEPCVKILGPGWDTLRILGVCSSLGPVLSCPWGLCIDKDGSVLVADWGEKHRVILYPSEGTGRVIVSEGLSSPRGLALLPNDLLVVSDSMHHCIKIFQYK